MGVRICLKAPLMSDVTQILSQIEQGDANRPLKIRHGDGTAHKLIYEKELYEQATALLADADDAAKKLGSLADYLKKHPSHLVWGRGVAWYKRAWRWALNKISGGGKKGDGPPAPPRPGRSDQPSKINLMEKPVENGSRTGRESTSGAAPAPEEKETPERDR